MKDKNRCSYPLFLMMLLSLGMICTNHCFGQQEEQYLLRHVFLPALSATNEVDIRMTGSMKLEQGNSMPYDATIEIRMPVEVKELGSDKSGLLAIQVAEFNTEQKVGAQSQRMEITADVMSVDGDVIWEREKFPGPHPMAELFGSRVEVNISPRGEVQDFSSLEGFSEMMPNVDISSQIAHGAIVFPVNPISVGQQWEEKGKTMLSTQGKAIDSLSRYTFKKIEVDSDTNEKIAVIEVRRTADAENVLMEYDAPKDPSPETGAVDVERLRLNKMEQDFTGTIRFNIDKGRIIDTQQEGRHYIDSTADLAYEDQKMRQETVADLNIEIRTRMIYEDE